MMMGSCFADARMYQKGLERKMAREYRECKLTDQIEMEEVAIAYAGKILEKQLPEEIFQEPVGVVIRTGQEELGTAFVGSSFALCVTFLPAGGQYYFFYDFYRKGNLELSGKMCHVQTRQEKEWQKKRKDQKRRRRKAA